MAAWKLHTPQGDPMAKNRETDGNRAGNESSVGLGVHAPPNADSAPGQSSASDWDMDKTKPSGKNTKPTQKSGKENEQPDTHNPPPGEGAQNEPAGKAQKTRRENQNVSENTASDKTLGVKPI